MHRPTLEQRVAALESQVASLINDPRPAKDWRRTIGAFTGDDFMKQIFEEGRKIREAERRQAKRPKRTKRSRRA